MTKKIASDRRSRAFAGDLMLAPMVALMRLPIMASEAQGSLPWRGETMRAVSEKMAATTEGLVAAQLSMIGSMAGFWPEVMSGRTPSMLNGTAVERSLQAALRPAGRRVKANFRRLSAKA